MLSKKEKQEMLADGQDQKRRNNFNLPKKIKNYSLDKFLGFLKGFQTIFPHPSRHHKQILRDGNKL